MASQRPTILVSNDDGIQAEGLKVLVKALRRVAHVIIVAPDRQQSASSHSITIHRPLRVTRHAADEYSVDGTPTDCITLAMHSILKKKPDLVVSGINEGANLSDDVHYSGTVSAAVEGALMGIRAIAVSLVCFGDQRRYYDTAAQLAARLARKVLREKLAPGFVLNLNVPNCTPAQIKGCDFTKLGKRNYGEIIFEKKDPRGKKYYWIGGDDRTFENIPGSDGNSIKARRASITPLQMDPTHYRLLEKMKHWRL